MRRSKFIVFLAIILALVLALGACSIQTETVNSPLTGVGGSDVEVENSVTQKPTEKQTENKTEKATQKPSKKPSGNGSKYSLEDKLIALTFDDGPRKSTTNKILDVLEKNNSAATFFIVGYNIDKNVDTIKRAINIGCEIANHSDGHKTLTKCTPNEIKTQVNNPIKTLKNLTGYEMKLFRAPGGHYKGVEAQIGMPLIQWTIDTEDWKYKDKSHEDRTAEERQNDIDSIVDAVVMQAKKGDIILMHDIYDFTADLCTVLVPRLVSEGFKLVTVSEMYEAYGTELEGGKVYRGIKFAENAEPAEAKVVGAYLVETNGNPLIIREEADYTSAMLGKIPNGTVVLVNKSVPGWAHVTYKFVTGWVSSKYLMKF